MTDPFAWQPHATQALASLGGAFVALPLGRGKTHWALDCAAQRRTLWVCPASLRAPVLRMCDTRGQPPPDVISYSALGRPEYASWLGERGRYDLVVLDEVHQAKNVSRSAVGRRLARYFHAHPGVPVVALSGSVYGLKPIDYMPALLWALRGHARRWGVPATLDRMVKLDERLRADETALARWTQQISGGEGVFVDAAPSWPGRVVWTAHTSPSAVTACYERLTQAWETPDGGYIGSALDYRRVESQLARGFWLAPDPAPSERLSAARREWARVVRRGMAYGVGDSDGELRAAYPRQWAEYTAVVADEPVPGSRPEFVDDSAERFVRGALALGEGPALVWVRHIELGERLARMLKAPYYRTKGLDTTGAHVTTSTAPVAVVSIDACSTGIELPRFCRNVLVELPDNESELHQLIGRTARVGQLSEQIDVHVWLPSQPARLSFETFKQTARDIVRITQQPRFAATA